MGPQSNKSQSLPESYSALVNSMLLAESSFLH